MTSLGESILVRVSSSRTPDPLRQVLLISVVATMEACFVVKCEPANHHRASCAMSSEAVRYPLHEAITAGDVDTVHQLFLECADPTERDQVGPACVVVLAQCQLFCSARQPASAPRSQDQDQAGRPARCAVY